MSEDWLSGLARRRRQGANEGVTSICSAHPLVLEASLDWAAGGPVLIEATCNQVNQDGGYTGMKPADFRRMVEKLADASGFDKAHLVLGGDHLGPNPWKHLDAGEAMRRAGVMVAEYVSAGFAKIHLDASMGCRGEPPSIGDEIAARRTAGLASIAEAAARRHGLPAPVYVIGNEVPVPGGAADALDELEVTPPEAALATIAAHREAFAHEGIAGTFDRVIAQVVQPGVEFDQDRVVAYVPSKAQALRRVLDQNPALVFEAHSTDYQPPAKLAALVSDGFAILKVGPALTFAMREALYGLDRIAAELDGDKQQGDSLAAAMERLMLAKPEHWRGHYRGDPNRQHVLRHFSYSDRIRYYWPAPEAVAATDALLQRFGEAAIPETLVSQFLPGAYPAVRDRAVAARPKALIKHAIRNVLSAYPAAARTQRVADGKSRQKEEPA